MSAGFNLTLDKTGIGLHMSWEFILMAIIVFVLYLVYPYRPWS